MIAEANPTPCHVAWSLAVELLSQAHCALEQTRGLCNHISEKKELALIPVETHRDALRLYEALDDIEHLTFMTEIGLIRLATLLKALDRAETVFADTDQVIAVR